MEGKFVFGKKPMFDLLKHFLFNRSIQLLPAEEEVNTCTDTDQTNPTEKELGPLELEITSPAYLFCGAEPIEVLVAPSETDALRSQ